MPGACAKILAPLNVAVFIFWMVLAEWAGRAWTSAAFLVWPLLFCLWCWPIVRGSVHIPWRTRVGLPLAIALSNFNIAYGFEYAMSYHGPSYTAWGTVISAAWWTVLAILAYRAWVQPSLRRNMTLHIAAFTWL